MEYFFSFILLVHVVSAIGIIGLVLVQHGKGADMGLRSAVVRRVAFLVRRGRLTF